MCGCSCIYVSIRDCAYVCEHVWQEWMTTYVSVPQWHDQSKLPRALQTRHGLWRVKSTNESINRVATCIRRDAHRWRLIKDRPKNTYAQVVHSEHTWWTWDTTMKESATMKKGAWLTDTTRLWARLRWRYNAAISQQSHDRTRVHEEHDLLTRRRNGVCQPRQHGAAEWRTTGCTHVDSSSYVIDNISRRCIDQAWTC